MLASPAQPQSRWHGRALTLYWTYSAWLLIGFIWQHVGAMHNPMFLAVFALPVIGAIFLSRWQPFLIAAVSVLVVAFAASARKPRNCAGMRTACSAATQWLSWLFGCQARPRQPSFSGFYAPSSYLLVLLEVFTVALFACAVAAEYIGTIFERLTRRASWRAPEAERGQGFGSTLIERLPLPALLIDPDTLQVVASSDFAAEFLRAAKSCRSRGASYSMPLRFSYPDLIHALIVGSRRGRR